MRLFVVVSPVTYACMMTISNAMHMLNRIERIEHFITIDIRNKIVF